MADYEANIAPFINVIFYVTSEWWEQPRNHRGLDIATPTSLGNVPLYSMCNGSVYYKSYDADGYGNYLILKDATSGMGFLYAHLNEPTFLNVGDTVEIGSLVGYEGTTGNSTGIHLHLEMQDISQHEWKYNAPKEVYTNPATFMGIPNQEGISVIYYGTPIEPIEPTKKSKNKWLQYKSRQKRIIFFIERRK